MNAYLEQDDREVNSEKDCINLNTGLNLSNFVVTKSQIDRLKQRQLDAIDQNKKPPGECAYYSILLGILHAQQNKPVKDWRQPWELVEVQISPPEILDIVKRYKDDLKLCSVTILKQVVEELNDLLAVFNIAFSILEVKTVVNFVRLFNNTNTKCIKNNVSLFSKLLLPKIEKADVKMIQLSLTLPKNGDNEIDCSFLRNPHYDLRRC